MDIKGINKLSDEEVSDVYEQLDIFSFEKYCGVCDNFDTEHCPFFGEVGHATEWEKIGCKNFWD